MRILVRDGVAMVHDLPGCEYEFAESCPHWRPLDSRDEDREAREAWERYLWANAMRREDGMYKLVEEHRVPGCLYGQTEIEGQECTCPAGWPRTTLGRCDG